MNQSALRTVGAVLFVLTLGTACAASEPETVSLVVEETITYSADSPPSAVVLSSTTELQFFGDPQTQPAPDIAAIIGQNQDEISSMLQTGRPLSLDPEPKLLSELSSLAAEYGSGDAVTMLGLADGWTTAWSNVSADALMSAGTVPNWWDKGCTVGVGRPTVLDPLATLFPNGVITMNLDQALTDRVAALTAGTLPPDGAGDQRYHVRDLDTEKRGVLLDALATERDAFTAQFADPFQATAAVVFDHTVFNCMIAPPGETCEDCSGCPGVLGGPGCLPPTED